MSKTFAVVQYNLQLTRALDAVQDTRSTDGKATLLSGLALLLTPQLAATRRVLMSNCLPS